MTLRKLPTDDRRVQKIAQLICECLWQEIRSRHVSFDLDILSTKVSKDLRTARLNVSSDRLEAAELLSFLESIRIPTQARIAQHRLRRTPVLSFFWDAEAVFLHRMFKSTAAQLTDVDE